MATIALERSGTTNLFWLILGLIGLVIIATFQQSDPSIAATGILLTLVSLLPLYLWLLGWAHGLPIWPVFSLSNGVTFALALLQDSQALDPYTPEEVIVGGITMVGFILLGTFFWKSFTANTPVAPSTILMIQNEHAVTYLFWFVAAGIFFFANDIAHFFYLPGNLMQVVRGVTLSLNAMGIFTLSYYHGRGLLTKAQVVLLASGVVVTLALGSTSLMLATAIVPAALAIFGYMLGSGRLPWRVLIVAFVCIALLHPGKWEMREKYWASGQSTAGLTLGMVPQFYSEWFGYGLQEVGGLAGAVDTKLETSERESTSAFERAGNAHMLLLVQKKSPGEVPFLNGLTYEHIPRMLIPRFLDDQKGISHAGNILLTVNYGLQTIEQTANTSIGWGLVPEAYANYGYVGIAALAFVLALYYAMMTRLSVGVPMTSLRFVLGLLVMAASTRADTMGVFVTTQFQAIAGLTMAALVLMRRQPNPFYAGKDPGLYGEQVGVLRKQFAPAGFGDDPRQDLHSADERANGASGAPAKKGVQLAADGAAVRTMPAKQPRRIARWMPRRVRAAVAAHYAELSGQTIPPQADADQPEAAGAGGQTAGDRRQRPRQLAVPFQNYRRYRG